MFAFRAIHGEYPPEPGVKSGRATNTKIDRSQPLRIQRTKRRSEAVGGVAHGECDFTRCSCAWETGALHFSISFRSVCVRC